MLVTVLGASGRTGSHVVRLLRGHGHTVKAGLRSRQRGQHAAALGAEPVLADLTTDPAGLVEVFLGSDAVINTAGAADPDPSAVAMVDRDGAIAAIGAAEHAGVARFVQLSAQFADSPDQGDRLVRSFLLAKQVSDSALRRSSLIWTLVRPGNLTDDPPTGRVKVAGHLEPGRISRADVAAVLVAALDEPFTENRGFDVIAGDTPVTAALAAFS
ncbi:NAD(P)H-binding protein [Amycolatopsis sp. CA-230715]|uniref:NAD(P)H-binding protein n=1 Tax=Amycolatopsis sp. CA-230715 TaxID=2745196 RepID=UPI001C0331DD|nr:NAD(P)H-binding protein [Amycolatopsis sp. CA-230715]QWF81319.1 putative sugar epimerase YhfK [Amycolatopsis sp. CA-230715]